MSEKASRKTEKQMVTAEHIAEEMRGFVIEAAQPGEPGESRKAMLRRASRKLGLNLRRVSALFYGEPLRIHADEYVNTITKIDEYRRKELETLKAKIAEYETDRETFHKDHPKLASLYAPSLEGVVDAATDQED